MSSQTYAARAKKHKNPLAKQLLELVERKQTNLCLSIDVTKSEELLRIVEAAAPYVCVVKVYYLALYGSYQANKMRQTHIDIVEDFSEDLVKRLTQLSEEHDFLIFGRLSTGVYENCALANVSL